MINNLIVRNALVRDGLCLSSLEILIVEMIIVCIGGEFLLLGGLFVISTSSNCYIFFNGCYVRLSCMLFSIKITVTGSCYRLNSRIFGIKRVIGKIERFATRRHNLFKHSVEFITLRCLGSP